MQILRNVLIFALHYGKIMNIISKDYSGGSVCKPPEEMFQEIYRNCSLKLQRLNSFQRFQEIFCADFVKNIRIIENSIRVRVWRRSPPILANVCDLFLKFLYCQLNFFLKID